MRIFLLTKPAQSEVALIQVLVHLPDSQLPLGKGCTQ